MKKFILSIMFLVLATNVWAEAKYSIKEMTPDVQNALSARRDRFEQLRSLKASGVIGENNRGYVQVLKAEGLAESITAAENADRKTIYQTIAQQNGLENAIGAIEQVFAQVQNDKAASGDKVETPDGAWITK